ncbi:MAG: flagellar hook-length control protein FliK [Sulfuricellaceae bacterium]
MPGLLIAPKASAMTNAALATGAAPADGATESAGASTFGALLAGQIKGNAQGTKSSAEVKSPEKTANPNSDQKEIDGLAMDDATTGNALSDFMALVNAGAAVIQITPTPLAPAKNDGSAAQLTGLAADQIVGLADSVATEGFAGHGKILPKSGLHGVAAKADPFAQVVEDTGRFALDGTPGNGKIVAAAEPIAFKTVLEEFKPGKPMLNAAGVGVGDAFASLATPQAAMMPGSHAVATHAPNMEIAAPVGSPGWGNALADKVTWMSNSQGNQVAELHLNPPHLGPLEVQLTITNDQASAVFVSPHPAVRDAIEAAMPRLRDMLADSGIMLGNTMVGAESFQQQQQQQAFAQHANGRGVAVETQGEVAGMGGVGPTDGGVVKAGKGMVDTFV